MVDDSTLRVEAAHTRAGVDTVLVDAGEAGDAVAVDDTLWPAVGRGAYIARLARAYAGAAAHTLLAVGAAGVLAARVRVFHGLDWTARGEWVASVSRWTDAAGNVPQDLALRAAAAGAHAGVDAVVVVASPVGGALVVADTLGPAGHVGVPKVICDTGAGGHSVVL